jgi:GNAT superfamily N-acetyltransferase
VDRWASPYLASQGAYLRHIGTAPIAEVDERDGVYAVRTGIASNTENGVVSAGDVPVTEAVVRKTLAWMNERMLAASWLCAEGRGREATARVLIAAGCEPERAAWETVGVIDRIDFDQCSLPAGVRVMHVSSSRELDAWLDVAGGCGWFETEPERARWKELHLGLGSAPSAPNLLYVAFRHDIPVGMASVFLAGETALLTAVGVLDHERRKGVGRALALTRLRSARERGCSMAVLAASPEGARLYKTLGFETHAQPEDRWFYLPPPTL